MAALGLTIRNLYRCGIAVSALFVIYDLLFGRLLGVAIQGCLFVGWLLLGGAFELGRKAGQQHLDEVEGQAWHDGYCAALGIWTSAPWETAAPATPPARDEPGGKP